MYITPKKGDLLCQNFLQVKKKKKNYCVSNNFKMNRVV